jgi:hypothetical protein
MFSIIGEVTIKRSTVFCAAESCIPQRAIEPGEDASIVTDDDGHLYLICSEHQRGEIDVEMRERRQWQAVG